LVVSAIKKSSNMHASFGAPLCPLHMYEWFGFDKIISDNYPQNNATLPNCNGKANAVKKNKLTTTIRVRLKCVRPTVRFDGLTNRFAISSQLNIRIYFATVSSTNESSTSMRVSLRNISIRCHTFDSTGRYRLLRIKLSLLLAENKCRERNRV
jgi:hypothetical protein